MILNLLDRMKLPFRKNKEFLSALYDILGFYPHNLEIYRIAFSHKSLGYHREADNRTSAKDRRSNASAKDRRKSRSENTAKPLNNERLEYLGDAVLESVVSDILFRHFPHKREGFLTSTRSKIVQREALNRLATDMGLEKLILAAQGTRMAHTNIGGNAFEALMGAIYLDRGYKHCHWFISNRIVGRYVNLDNVAQKEVNFKSKLLEWSQKNRININFKDSAADDRGFKTIITMEGITLARGNGRSKKESQQEASKEALTRMRREPKTYDSIFRAKEKRTAMEAEESFALPKIDEIENTLSTSRKGNKAAKSTNDDAPVLEERKDKRRPTTDAAEAAYDTAYDESASFEVIDTPPVETQLTADVYEEKGLPAPPEEDELRAADEKLRKKRTRNRGPKTVGDAVKGVKKGETTAEEKAEKRANERIAEVERQRAKAERKRQQKQAQEQQQAAQAAEEVQTATEAQTADMVTETKTEPKAEVKVEPAVETNHPVDAPVEKASTDVQTEAAPEESPADKPYEAMTPAEREAKAQEVAAIVCGIMDKYRIAPTKPQASAETTAETEVETEVVPEATSPQETVSQVTPQEVDLVIKEDISDVNTAAADQEAEAIAEETAEDTLQDTEEIFLEAGDLTPEEEEKPQASDTSLPQAPALTLDAIVFSSEHDDNLGLLSEAETTLTTDKPTSEAPTSEVPNEATSSPAPRSKRRPHRRPKASAPKTSTDKSQSKEANKGANKDTNKGANKVASKEALHNEGTPDQSAPKPHAKQSHRRRRPTRGKSNNGGNAAPQAQQ